MHFTVLVIGENVDEQLSPFDENLEVDEPEVVKTKLDLINEFKFQTDESLDGLSEDEIWKKAIDYFGYDSNEIDEETGDIICTWNQNGEWDWYQIGGRWAGQLQLKDTVDPKLYSSPNFSWGWDSDEKDEVVSAGRVDQAKKKDIANLDEICTYAYIKNGEWYSSDAPLFSGPNDSFKKELQDFIKEADEEDLITIVDCHV